ncbi:Hypothetical_protein [Hexamita inflata]|uniref:Hypothetical_protein n=1 Tax=Hexamita inflata TaxID=28002 RepID=A0AA86QP08_9EUKA|nr:Hypothetical protein HINF_LOCUS47892 [Hexamita inflata]
MITMILHVFNNMCEDYDCNGFECREFTIQNTTMPYCMCNQQIFGPECRYCRNFKYSIESNCTECVYSYLDPIKACKSCIASPRLDAVKGCSQCVNKKYDIRQVDKCKNEHMDFSKDCNSCEGKYILLVNECISKSFSNFTIYFGIIFSNLAIIAVLVLVRYQNKHKQKPKGFCLLTEESMYYIDEI